MSVASQCAPGRSTKTVVRPTRGTLEEGRHHLVSRRARNAAQLRRCGTQYDGCYAIDAWYAGGMVTFGVDEVEPAAAPLPVSTLGERYRDALAFGGDADASVIAHGDTHPLLAAVGIAFAQHRPLVLSPDAVWLTIAQGVAQHVRHNAEELRARLVRHDGRKRLEVVCDALPSDAGSWRAAIGELRRVLGDEIGDGRARLFECDFSTSTEVERTVGQIVLLDAYSPYYSYWMMYF